MLANESIKDLADQLLEAERSRIAVPPLTDEYPDLSERDAYQIQQALLSERGQEFIGYKLGFTSTAMREQMEIDSPNFGLLTTDMQVRDDRVDLSGLIHPRIEPEIALLTTSELRGPNLESNDVCESVSHLYAAIEVVDSRYIDYRFREADNTADNSSAARFLLGDPVPVVDAPRPDSVEAELQRNGLPVARGNGTNVMGDPFSALAWLANRLGDKGRTIERGSIVLSGGLTAAYPVEDGDFFEAVLSGLGTVEVSFAK